MLTNPLLTTIQCRININKMLTKDKDEELE